MKIAIDILTTQRDELLKDIESRVQTRNRLIENIGILEEKMDKDLEDLVSINRTLDLLENNQ